MSLSEFQCRRTPVAMLQAQSVLPALRPLPLVLPLSLSTALLLSQNVHLIAACILEERLGTPTRLDKLSVNLFGCSVTVGGFELRDSERLPLLAVPRARARLRFQRGWLGSPKIDVQANDVHVTAVLVRDKGRLTTNWSKMSAAITEEGSESDISNRGSSNTESTNRDSTDPRPSESNQKKVPIAFDVLVKQPRVTLLTEKGYRLIGAAPLPSLHVTSKQVSSVAGAAMLVDGIVSRVIRQAGTGSLPGDLRRAVRQWARSAAAPSLVDDAIAWSKLNIDLLRRRVQQVQKAVDQLPGLNDIQDWTRNVDRFLTRTQRILQSPDESSSSSGESRNSDTAHRRASRNRRSSSDPFNDFRELDEDS